MKKLGALVVIVSMCIFLTSICFADSILEMDVATNQNVSPGIQTQPSDEELTAGLYIGSGIYGQEQSLGGTPPSRILNTTGGFILMNGEYGRILMEVP